MSVLIQDRGFQTIEEMSTREYDALSYQELQQRFPEMRYACLDLNALAELKFVMKFPLFERVRKSSLSGNVSFAVPPKELVAEFERCNKEQQ